MGKRQLVLEDGTVFVGNAFGSMENKTGEVVFNTGMTGYQETLSDPSCAGQIVTMTYPLIGNYGINRDDFESIQPSINGLIVKEMCDHPTNFRNEETLDSFLKANNIPGLSGVDTRKLTKIIRNHGTMKGMFAPVDASVDQLVADLKELTLNHEVVKTVSTTKPYVVPGRGYRIVLVDFGMKHGILRELTSRDCHVTVVPYHYSADNILRLKPDGIMLTNGPGNPKDVPDSIETVKQLIGKIPLFGICLGHQLISLACGADTEKLKFGHRGSNHPVKDLQTNKTYMTSQNHGYAVTKESLEQTELELIQVALNDGTVEGVKHRRYPVLSAQYHPESSPGPADTNYLFDQFMEMIQMNKKKQNDKEVASCQSVQI